LRFRADTFALVSCSIQKNPITILPCQHAICPECLTGLVTRAEEASEKRAALAAAEAEEAVHVSAGDYEQFPMGGLAADADDPALEALEVGTTAPSTLRRCGAAVPLRVRRRLISA